MSTQNPIGAAHTDQKIKLLLVEDDDGDAALLRHYLASIAHPEFSVARATTLLDAVTALAEDRVDGILLDLSLPDASGLEALEAIVAAGPDAPIIVLTGLEEADIGLDLIRLGAQDFLPKSQLTSNAIHRSVSHSIERYRLARELTAARSKALEASSAKSDFVASVSHEIRTPMNAILGIADLLERTELDPQQREYVHIFQRSGKSLLSLINDVLDMSRIESGKLTLECHEFDPSVVLDETAETFAFAAHKKCLGFSVDIADDVPARCEGDSDRIRQVLANLIGNAIKFTESGEIAVSLARSAGGGLLFAVEDSGIGVDGGRYDRLFEPFEQGGENIHRRYGGTGLGLALSRDLVEKMGGKISAWPAEGQGSRFEFDVAVAELAAGHATHRIESKRVLIAMKHAGERALLKAQLVRAGASVTVVARGEEILPSIAAAQTSSSPFHALVMDARLPGSIEGGPSVAAQSGWSGQTIVLLPLDHRQGDMRKCDDIGYRKMLKPVSHRALIEILQGGDAERREVVPVEAESRDLERARILLVDDSPDNRMVAEAYLADVNVVVVGANDGADAIRRFIDEEAFDIILMDMQMPIVDGYEATREIRRLEQLEARSRVPVIALTADAFSEHRERAERAGCDDHLAKPIARKTLLDTIEKWTKKTTPVVALPEVDPAIADLVPGFVARRKDDIELLSAALKESDFETLRRISHNLKGSGLSFGFPRLSELGSTVEQAAIAHDCAAVARGIESIREELQPYCAG